MTDSTPSIETTEDGWVWTAPNGDRHELNAHFGTVHVHVFFPNLQQLLVFDEEDLGL